MSVVGGSKTLGASFYNGDFKSGDLVENQTIILSSKNIT